MRRIGFSSLIPLLLERFSRLMPFWVILLGFVGYFSPRLLLPLEPYLSWFFLGTMVGVGALLERKDFLPVFRQPQYVLIGTACQFLIMPLSGYIVAKVFAFPLELAFGFVLVGSVPGAMASLTWRRPMWHTRLR